MSKSKADRTQYVWSSSGSITIVVMTLWLWRKQYDCLLYYFTASQCLLKGAVLTFSSTSNQLTETCKA